MITVFGSINMDLIANTDRLPKPGETIPGTNFSTAAGGKGANQALAARRAGASVRMAGAVGKDGFATEALALLDEAGTDLSLVKRVEGPTGTALILVGGTGENMIAVVPAANGKVDQQAAVAAVSAMSAGDILMMQLEVPAASVETAFAAARETGVTTIFNIAPFTGDSVRLAGLADIVVANETEFALLAGGAAADPENAEARLEALNRLHGERGQTYVVTLGGDGAIAIRDGKLLRVESLKIEPVDTVGAGDTFCGYLAAGLDQGLAFEEALKRAAIAGSLACLTAGAQPSIPTAAMVEARL
jgi:ribokinase